MKALSLSFASIALLTLLSCNGKEEPQSARAEGEEIIFGAVSNAESTKASYSGELDADSNERINWQTGDRVRIVCPQASAPTDRYLADHPSDKYEDYTVTSVKSDGAQSSAGITHPGSNIGLRWGTGLHYFYSMYPCPSDLDQKVNMTDDGTNIKATCILPATQSYGSLSKDSNNNYTATANPLYMYLIGYATASSTDSGPVQIEYNPAFTSFEITVQNDFASKNDMTVASAGIFTSESGKYLTGTDGEYQVRINDNKVETADISSGTGSQSVTMNFSEGNNSYITLAYGKKLTFTLFAQPGHDISQLTFTMTDKDGAVRSSALKYRKATDTDWVTFKALHKSRITGLMAPETSRWYINLGGDKQGDIALEDYQNGYDLDVTQVTLKQTTLDLYYKDGEYYKSAEDANAGTGAISSCEIDINGEYEQSGYLSSSVDSSLSSYIASAIQNKSGKQYKLVLTLTGTPSSEVSGNVNVGDSNTNSTAHVAITIHSL